MAATLYRNGWRRQPNLIRYIMDNSLKLIPAQNYRVVKPFTDYDGIVHGTGETWTYLGTHFYLTMMALHCMYP